MTRCAAALGLSKLLQQVTSQALNVCTAAAQVDRAKVLSNSIKQKRKEKAGKWEVPLPKVRRLLLLITWH